MDGIIDNELRALVEVKIGSPDGEKSLEVPLWIDTAFNGSIVLPERLVDELLLPQQSTAEAILADGKKVELATFGCAIEWFGKSCVSQITTSSSKYGLLGTALLDGRKLEVDYARRTVAIN